MASGVWMLFFLSPTRAFYRTGAEMTGVCGEIVGDGDATYQPPSIRLDVIHALLVLVQRSSGTSDGKGKV